MTAAVLGVLILSYVQPSLVFKPITITTPSRVLLPAGAIWPAAVEVVIDPRFREALPPLQGSHLILRVLDVRNDFATVAEIPFYTSYGTFELTVVPLSGSEPPELVLVTGDGVGTNVRKETLVVYANTDRALRPILAVPVSGFFGFGRWWYERQFEDVNGDSRPDIRLILKHDPIEASNTNNPRAIPDAAVLEYTWSDYTHCMHLRERVNK